MAVSLVSTGVQFPDSTIQTTAASGGTSTLLASVTATASATVNLAFSGSYYAIQIIGTNIYPLTAGRAIEIRYTTNNFSSVSSFASGSSWGNVLSSTGSGYQFTPFAQPIPGNELPGFTIDMLMTQPSGSMVKQLSGTLVGPVRDSGSTYNWIGTYSGYTTSLFTAINGIQFKPGDGNMQGTFKVYGLS